jgi:predicted AlkP superfamily pyrophosphatase or phosphodiesterase
MAERVVVLMIPQLRHQDVAPGGLACLEDVVRRGGLVDFRPPFPSTAASASATLLTGVGPSQHGVIGDAYFDRELGRVVGRPFQDDEARAPKVWDRLREVRPGATTLAWFTPSLRGASVDRAAWIEPESGLTTEPASLAAALELAHGPYPAPRVDPSGDPLRLAATRWILESAAAQIRQTRPDLAIVRVPYLGQVARRFGPDSAQAGRAVLELQGVLGPFLKGLDPSTTLLVVTESVSTPVTEAIYPNLILRGLGLLELEPAPGGGLDVDTSASAAFALADHQLAHIYVNDPAAAATIASTFTGPEEDGVASVTSGPRRARLGLNHPRCGDIILVARPDHYFASDWWMVRSERPAQPRRGSGLAIDARIDPSHILGSLGAPAPSPEYLGVIISSRKELLPSHDRTVEPTEIESLLLNACGRVEAPR